jgi:hypothetical protein
MSFEALLKDLVDRVPQAIGAIMVDWEGEAVATAIPMIFAL